MGLFDHKDANRAYWSYELVRWLTEGPGTKWNMVLGNLPLRASERTSATFAATVKQYPGYDVLAANLDNATQKRPTVKGYVELSKAFGKAVSRLLQGDGDVKAEARQGSCRGRRCTRGPVRRARTGVGRGPTMPSARGWPAAPAAGVGWAFVGPSTLPHRRLVGLPRGLGVDPPSSGGTVSSRRAMSAGATTRRWPATELLSAISHTVFYTILFVPASVLGGLLIAIALNREIRFIGFYRTCVFVLFVASATAIGILANYIFDPQFGFANTIIKSLGGPVQRFLEDPTQAMMVIAVMTLWSQLGFTVVVYLAALQDIPKGPHRGGHGRRREPAADLPACHLAGADPGHRLQHHLAAHRGTSALRRRLHDDPRRSAGATQTIVYYLWDQAFQQLKFGYGSAIAYALFGLTLLITFGDDRLLPGSPRCRPSDGGDDRTDPDPGAAGGCRSAGGTSSSCRWPWSSPPHWCR